MLDDQVRFLDVLRVVAGHGNRDVHQFFQAPSCSRQCHGVHPDSAGSDHGPNDIRRTPACADSKQQVPRPTEGLNLSLKYAVETEIVGKAVSTDVSVVSAMAGKAGRGKSTVS